jgi:hypothetical protein
MIFQTFSGVLSFVPSRLTMSIMSIYTRTPENISRFSRGNHIEFVNNCHIVLIMNHINTYEEGITCEV